MCPKGQAERRRGGVAQRAPWLLVVDDDTRARYALVRMLRGLGIRSVIEAGDGSEALARCDRIAFDAILCDADTAPVDGLTFLQSVRTRPQSLCRSVPVLLLTARSTPTLALAAREGGASALLLKPPGPDLLRQKLNRALALPAPIEQKLSA